MSWTDTLGKIAKSVGDFTGITGLVHDVSSSLSNTDPWYIDGLNVIKDIGKIATTLPRGAISELGYVGQKSYEAGGWVRQKIEEGVLDTPFMYNKFKNQDETYDQYRERVNQNKSQISLGQATLSLFSPGKNSGDRSGWFQDWTEHNLKFMSAGFDLFNPNDRKEAFQNQYTGKIISGMEDVVASTIIDPLTFTGFLGKGAVIVSKGLRYENINGKLARAVFGHFAATNESMDNIITKALVDKKGQAWKDINFLAESNASGQAGYWADKKVTNPDAMAYLFGRANTPEEVVQTFKAVLGKDTNAMATIAEKDPEAALVFNNMNEVPHEYKEFLNGNLDGDLLISPEYAKSMSSYVSDLATNDTRYRAALNQVATGGTQFKYGFERGFAKGGAIKAAKKEVARTFGEPVETIFQKTSLHPAIRVVNYFSEERPSGIFHVNDGNSYREFNTFLREANDLSKGTFGPKAREFADSYLAAQTEGERLDVIALAENEAITHLFPGYDKDTINKIYAIYDTRRAKAIQQHKDKGFVSYFEGDSIQHSVSLPVLQSESANIVIIADLRKLKRGIDAHSGVLPGLLSGIDVEGAAIRGKRAVAALDTVNDIFKTSVLMRLGYTTRNLAEGQLSMMAKGFALPSIVATGGTKAVARFFHNRKIGFDRLSDQVLVATGHRDDFGVLQNEFALETDKLRSIDASRQNLAKEVSKRIAEIEGSTVGPTVREITNAITSDISSEHAVPTELAQRYAFEDELKRLKGVLSDLESQTLYHGSAEGIELDSNRGLALSASPGIARRYADGGTIHNAEQYIKTPSGRPGKLTQKPEAMTAVKVAQNKLNEKQRQLVQAQKDMASAGRTQWDISLLEKSILDLKAEVKKASSAAKNAEKRAVTTDEATHLLRTDMIDAVNKGRKVEIDYNGKWRRVSAIDYNTLTLAAEEGEVNRIPFTSQGMERAVFRVNAGGGQVEPFRVYGPAVHLTRWSDVPLELRDSAFGGKAANFKQWIASKGWSNPDDPVFKYMRDNGFGRAVVADDRRAGGISHIALPEAIGAPGRDRAVNSKISNMMQNSNVEYLDEEQRLTTSAERRRARKNFIKKQRSGVNDIPVSPYYNKENLQAIINNGIEDAAENLVRAYARSHAHLDDMSNRIGARIDATESMAVKQRLGYGTSTIDANGHSYTLPKVFEGASWLLSRTSGEQTWNAQVAAQEMAFTAGIGAKRVSLIQPNDPRYYEGWANILNMHFRNPETGKLDPVVEKIIDGQDDETILGWFKLHEGSLYANNTYTRVGQGYGFTKIKGGELDEELIKKIRTTRGAVKAYIPDDETATLLKSLKDNGKPETGGAIQKFLVDRFGSNPENLTPLNGLLVTTSKEYKDQERLIDTINRRVMRFLGSLPEDVFARHPLASAVYDDQLRKNIAAMSAFAGVDGLTAEELNRAVRAAREKSRQEVEKTLFTIIRRTGASSSQTMKLLFPFYGAFENTLQRWGGMVAENPAIVANTARTVAQVINGQMVVDQNGNQIKDLTQLTKNANLVIRVPQAFIDSLPKGWRDVVQDSFKNIRIPLSSLDVITQGQPGNPGVGPYAVLPAYVILKDKPELENAFSVFFPAGIPQSATDLFEPPVLKRLMTMWKKDDLYVRTFNQMLRYETYRYNTGKRTDAPTIKEVTSRTNKFYMLRALTSISMPFSVAPEVDFYRQQYLQLQQKYANYVDPTTGKPEYGKADAEFLSMYPDFFEATVSLSKNVGGIEPSIATVSNLKKFDNLMAISQQAGDPELIGFLANDGDNKYTFSQAAYQWLYGHGAAPGSGSSYLQNRSAGDIIKEANIKKGWTEYQALTKQIDVIKIQNGITSDRDPQLKVINDAKKLWLRWQAKNNLEWYSAYAAPDKAKYERRAQILNTALHDKAWMDQNGKRTVVKNMALYLDVRSQMAKLLDQREKDGGSRNLNAKSNADLNSAYDQFRTQLIAESPETESFLNRYFANDTVVI